MFLSGVRGVGKGEEMAVWKKKKVQVEGISYHMNISENEVGLFRHLIRAR